MDEYTTTTMKDFVYYPTKRTSLILPQIDSCHPFSVQETLLVPGELAKHCDAVKCDSPQEYMKKVLKENPNLGKKFEKGIPKDDLILQAKKDLKKTVYFVDYCTPGSEIVSARTLRKNRVALPKDTKIPETTQKSSYRDPKIAVSMGFDIRVKPISKPSGNLTLSGTGYYQGKMINSFLSTYMGDYKWPYLSPENYREDGECFYYPTSYKPMDYYPDLLDRSDVVKQCNYKTTEHFAPCNLKKLKNVGKYRQSINVSTPYNNLHCTCHECIRQMKCTDTRMDLKERYPFIYKPEDRELTRLNEMMAKVYKNHFRTTYQTSYSRDPCQVYMPRDTVPYEATEIDRCCPIEKPVDEHPRDPLLFRITSSANNPPQQRPDKRSSQGLVRPWNSEYMDGISRTGGRIIMENFRQIQAARKNKCKTRTKT